MTNPNWIETPRQAAAIEARQMASRRVTRSRRACSCVACKASPRSPGHLIATRR